MRIAIFTVLYFLISTSSFSNDFEDKSTIVAPAPIYWIGGSGVWDDPNHWAKTSGGIPFATIPNEDTNVIFDNNSGLVNGTTITVPPGDFATNDFSVQTNGAFNLVFNGSSGNLAAMNVFGDLSLTTQMNLSYTDPSAFHNVWRFLGSNVHDLTTNGQDLSSVEFNHVSGEYNQQDNLMASERIRMFGGEWNTNGHDINAGYLLFQDNSGSGSPLNKNFNASTSTITCDQWNSRFSYQSLTVTGDYVVFTARFMGSPGTPSLSFYFKEIHLTEFEDDAPGGFSQIEHNNFDCAYCEVEKLIIEDTDRTQLAGIFTVTDEFRVVNIGSEILFNGGNSYGDEVILECAVYLPVPTGCEERTRFSNVYNDFTTVTSDAPLLAIKDAIVNNMQTNGSANFELNNSVLQGSSAGWNLINPPVSEDYLWIGTFVGATADWDDPANWELLAGGSNGCIPSIVDDVYVNNDSKSEMRIPSPFKAQCRDFIWTNTKGREIILDGQTILESELLIAGDFELDTTATVTANNNHELIFSSATTCQIQTNGVHLPDIYFVGDLGFWNLNDHLICDQIIIEGGTIDTDNNDVETDVWLSVEDNPKHYIFGSSNIKVNGEMKLAQLPNNNVTVSPGTSLIECEKLTSAVPVLYDVQLNNSNAVLLDNWPQSFNKLILNGSGSVGTAQDLTLNDLVFNVDDSELQVNTNYDFIINGVITSLAAKTTPGILRSNNPGTQANVDKALGNLCVTGYVGIQDINSILNGTLHAPLGFDDGNNSNITFDGGSTSPDLFWIGGSGDWDVQSNWSRVTGGCPANKNPNNSPNLVFDNNSFTNAANQIDLTAFTVCNNIFFRNTQPLTLDISVGLFPDSVFVDGGDARFEGEELTTSPTGLIVVDHGGIFITDVLNGFTPQIDLKSGIHILRSGSNFGAHLLNIEGTFVAETGAYFSGREINVLGSGMLLNSGHMNILD